MKVSLCSPPTNVNDTYYLLKCSPGFRSWSPVAPTGFEPVIPA